MPTAFMFRYLARRFRTSSATSPNPEKHVHLALRPQQVLQDRYKILSRLGEGQHSTVWLAEDSLTTSTPPARKNVAVKVLTDFVTSIQEEQAFELRVMERIANIPSSNPTVIQGTRNLLPLFDHFMCPGTHGDHLCLVTEALGPSVQEVTKAEPEGRVALPLDVVKHLTRQLLRALETLHDGCNTVHTDIKPDNILFRRSTLTSDGEFDTDRVFDPDNVVLIDYDTAMPLDMKMDRLIQPEALRCPEVLVGCEWGVKADIWNLGCIVFELLTANSLFRPRAHGKYTAEQYHLARIFGTLSNDAEFERLQAFCQTGRRYDDFFGNAGRLKLRIGPEYRESLQQILEIYGVYTPDLLEFLAAMLRVHPDDRLTAHQLRTLPWLHERL
ncbi:kinase-like protein [Irpex rosettiformis]|uniref:Kinase-like protein n=1 Tax=Irpex rosettiformis TaxID=378272 RepID=A0ACB8TS22_9APHY|nr:kinase-like protein [Irpex rosettiformis]